MNEIYDYQTFFIKISEAVGLVVVLAVALAVGLVVDEAVGRERVIGRGRMVGQDRTGWSDGMG